MERLIIVGSPRSGGRSAHLADALMDACIEECPEDGLSVLSVGGFDIDGCIGCDGCKLANGAPGPNASAATAGAHDAADEFTALPCVIEDDMTMVRGYLDHADELIIVTPVYFSGVPSQLKAWLDRLQPYFWTERRHGALRPAVLHIVGEGADPFGFSGVISAISSAILCAGFSLEQVFSWIGKIDRDGEILDEADEIALEDAERVDD